MNREQIKQFAKTNQDAMLIIALGVDDYIACRCCLLNGLFHGLMLAAQSVEKILKGYLFIKGHPNPRKFKHNLTDLANEVENYNDYRLKTYHPLIRRLKQHYQARYHDNPDRSKYMSTDEIREIDELVLHLINYLPMPDEVKFRSGIYCKLFEYKDGVATISQCAEAIWATKQNDAIARNLKSLIQKYAEVTRQLYPNMDSVDKVVNSSPKP